MDLGFVVMVRYGFGTAGGIKNKHKLLLFKKKIKQLFTEQIALSIKSILGLCR